jgi:hypothetical protein
MSLEDGAERSQPEPAWKPSQRYPDPSVRVLDQSFAKYRLKAQ